jgi:beta-glucanase (GH16 family)
MFCFPRRKVPASPSAHIACVFNSTLVFCQSFNMRSIFNITALTTLFSTTLATTPETVPGFTPTWTENFAGTAVNTANWAFWTGTPSNGEQEVYPGPGVNCQLTPSNTLLIVPEKTGGKWTSCRLESHSTFAASPGKKMRVQARLKLGQPGAQLQGIWPAFWSLGAGIRNNVGWPACGEIDTFENIDGSAMGYGTIHCGAKCNDPTGLSQGVPFDYGSFHTWAHVVDLTSSDWTKQSIEFLLDGNVYNTITGATIGDRGVWNTLVGPMFMTLNVAVGGAWPGSVPGSTVSGAAAGMEVQYVAVYNST